MFFFTLLPPTVIHTLSLHDALPICLLPCCGPDVGFVRYRIEHVEGRPVGGVDERADGRSEEHTSELQSRGHLVCRLLLEKKKQLDHGIRCGPALVTTRRCLTV